VRQSFGLRVRRALGKSLAAGICVAAVLGSGAVAAASTIGPGGGGCSWTVASGGSNDTQGWVKISENTCGYKFRVAINCYQFIEGSNAEQGNFFGPAVSTGTSKETCGWGNFYALSWQINRESGAGWKPDPVSAVMLTEMPIPDSGS